MVNTQVTSIYLRPGSVHYLAIIGFDIGMQLAETGKIRIFKQSPGSFVHPFKVRSLEQTATILTIERHLGRSNIVFVCTCRGIKARMSIGTYGTQTVNGNIRGSRRFSLSVMNITSNGVSLSKCATIREACTPASVRPAPTTSTSRRNKVESAFIKHSCTLAPLG